MADHIVTTILERERELDELTRALTAAQQSRGRLIVIEGQAGLGKTSLLRAAARAAGDMGFTCLRARASELERDFAYGCVRQLLEPAIAKSAEPGPLFDGAAALAKRLFTGSDAGLPSPVSADSTFAMLHGLYWLLNNLAAEAPVALCIDDLHWCDSESVRLLNYLAPRLDGLAIAVFASTRTGEHVTPDIARLLVGPEATVLRPEPLSLEATATLCERALGQKIAPAFAAACRNATGGNPFFLEALLREAQERGLATDARGAAGVQRIGPAAVAQALRLHLAAAPSAATALVRAAAVLGDGASIAEVARLGELDEGTAAREADRLATLAILKAADGVEFAHSIVREAVYADIGSHERARAHARAVRVLVECAASEERIAAQIMAAEPSGDIGRVTRLRRVAQAALAQGAPAAAIAWLRRALAEPPTMELRPEVLLELGTAELRLALPEAAEHLVTAVDAITDPALLAIAARHLANALSMSGNADHAVAALEAAVERIEHGDRELALVIEAEIAAKALQASREMRGQVAGRLARYENLAGGTPGERLVLASIAFERARASESANVAAQHIERGLDGGRLLDGQQPDVVGPFYALVIGLLATDALELADACLAQALADARARTSIPAMAFLTAHRGWFALRRGVVAQAEADARTALDLMTVHDIRLGNRFALALLVQALLENGDLRAAELAFESGALGAAIPPGLANNHMLEARARLHGARGNHRAAFDDMVEFGRRDELWGASNALASRWRSAACLALAATGENEPAHDMWTEDLERAQRWGAASGRGIALRAGGLLASGAAAVDRLRTAVEVLERSPAKLEHARAVVDFGAAQRRANQRIDARRTLAAGLELAQRCGAGALVDRARTELRAAGGRWSDPAGSGAQRLTVAERRVAELAAKGHSNPQIAQTLFVTRKTVETHLGHVYTKLDISGRAELAWALARDAAAPES